MATNGTKSDLVRTYVSGGDFKKALAIAKDFRLGITEEERDAMKRAYECMVHPRLYRSIGFDLEAVIQNGIETVRGKYG